MSCPVCRKDHGGACHKCPHEADVQAGKYRGREFNKSPCFGCRQSYLDPSNGFRTHVSAEHVAALKVQPPVYDADEPARAEPPAERLAGFLVAWCTLPPKTQRVVSMRLLHVCGHTKHTYKAIGRSLRIYPQEAESRLNRALRDLPVLREAFRLKIVKAVRRKGAAK